MDSFSSTTPSRSDFSGNKIYISGEPTYPLNHTDVLSLLEPGSDRRVRINSPSEWPNSPHGRLLITSNGELHLFSGTLIGPRLVLTAAQNIYSRSNRKEFDKNCMEFIPGMNGFASPYGRIRVVKVYYPQEYKALGEEDYALLVLEENIGDFTGWYDLKPTYRSDIYSRNVGIYGFPAVMRGQNANHSYLWGMIGSVKVDMREDMLDYDIDTTSGQAGSAVWYTENDKFYVIGVHVHDFYKGKRGVYLNRSRVARIKEWCSDFYTKIFQPIRAEYEISRDLKTYLHQLSETSAKEYITSLDLRWKNIAVQEAQQLSEVNLPNLVSLNLSSNNLGCEGIQILSSGNLGQITSLYLESNWIRIEGAAYLAHGNFENLQKLDLACNKLGSEGVRELVSGKLGQLNSLKLRGNWIGPEGAHHLARGNLVDLAHLDLSWNNLRHEGAREIASGNFLRLTSLDLSANEIGNEGARQIAESELRNLTSLNLSSNWIREEGARYLANGNLASLSSLYLQFNTIGPNGAQSIAAGNLTNLSTLDLYGDEISNAGCVAVSRGNFVHMMNLNLGANSIGVEGVRQIAAGRLKRLVSVNLSRNTVGNDGAKLLAQGNLETVNSLNLEYSGIEQQGVRDIARGKLERLKSLYLSGNEIGDEGARELTLANFRLDKLSIRNANLGEMAIKELEDRVKEVLI